jgi:hypothetical protein
MTKEQIEDIRLRMEQYTDVPQDVLEVVVENIGMVLGVDLTDPDVRIVSQDDYEKEIENEYGQGVKDGEDTVRQILDDLRGIVGQYEDD